MKKNTHPKYQKILFVDTSTGRKFVCGAAMDPEEKEVYEGVEYPVFHVPISSYSHPLFSGQHGLVDTEGRIDKFKKRYQAKQQAAKKQAEAVKEAAEQPPKKKAAKKKKT